MTTKDGVKSIVNRIVEESIESSSYIKKLTDCITMAANEIKKIADLAVLLNQRLNDHEKVILHLVELQKQKADKTEVDFSKIIKKDTTKPN